jgi:hypothetical protein
LKDLGDIPNISNEQKSQEIQLILENRFKKIAVMSETDTLAAVYQATKELVIQILRAITPDTSKKYLSKSFSFSLSLSLSF